MSDERPMIEPSGVTIPPEKEVRGKDLLKQLAGKVKLSTELPGEVSIPNESINIKGWIVVYKPAKFFMSNRDRHLRSS